MSLKPVSIDKFRAAYFSEGLIRTIVMVLFYSFVLGILITAAKAVFHAVSGEYWLVQVLVEHPNSIISFEWWRTWLEEVWAWVSGSPDLVWLYTTLLAAGLLHAAVYVRQTVLSILFFVAAAYFAGTLGLLDLATAEDALPVVITGFDLQKHRLIHDTQVLPRIIMLCGLFAMMAVMFVLLLIQRFGSLGRGLNVRILVPKPVYALSVLGALSGTSLGQRRFNSIFKDKALISLVRGLRAAKWIMYLYLPFVGMLLMYSFVSAGEHAQLNPWAMLIPPLVGIIGPFLIFPRVAHIIENLLVNRLSEHLIRPPDDERNVGLPPVLFLRSFTNDKARIEFDNGKPHFLSLGRFHPSIDAIILDELTAIGPPVALGWSMTGADGYGATRLTTQDDTWREEFERFGTSATAIVLVLGDTESLKWEIDQIWQRGWLDKTIFLAAPEWTTDLTGRRLYKVLGERIGPEAKEHRAREQPIAVGFKDGTAQVLTTRRQGTDASYTLALRALVRWQRSDKKDEP